MFGRVGVAEAMISDTDFRVIHVFPYTAHMAGGHSNAIIGFMEGQSRSGIDVRGICPVAGSIPRELERRILHLPIRELDFNAPNLCELAMESVKGCHRPLFHFHGYIRQFRKLSLHLARAGVHYVTTSHGQLHYREKFHWLKKFLFINFADAFFHNASGLHFLTEREMMRSSFVLPFWGRPILVQPNLIETPDPATIIPEPRDRHGIPANAFVFAYLGRLHVEHKGLDLILRSFAKLTSKCDAYLIFIGGDWEGGREHLEDLARQLGCCDRIRFLGMLQNESKWKALKMADAFVGPSRWEAFGIAQAEAMSFGLPTLLSDTMNLASDLARHKAALLSPLSALMLANSMLELVRDERLRSSLSESGQKWTRENCSPSVAVGRFENFYRQVLGDIEVTPPVSYSSNTAMSNSLSVVHLFPYSPKISGGHSNAIRSFIECQRANGIGAVGVVAREGAAPLDTDLGFPIIEVDSFASINWASIQKKLDLTAGSFLVHFHNVTSAYAPLIRELRQLGIPFVFTGHGQFSYRNTWHGLKKFVYFHTWNWGPRRADGLQFLAKDTERRARFLLPGYKGDRLVLGNLVPIPDLAKIPTASRDEYNVPKDAFVLLFLGRLDVNIKGLDLLVEAFSCLPPDKFFLILAGPDWKGGKARLAKLAEQFRCQDRVRFPGAVYGEKKWSLFKMVDLFVSPSRYEAFNITQAEAMASGLPVVTSVNTSLSSQLREAGAALLSPLNAESLAQAIGSLEGDAALRQILSTRGREWVQMNCDPTRAGERFRRFYEAILERRARRT